MAIKTITVKGDPIRKEYLCDAALTPGHLCERTSTGAKVHATAAGPAARMFALEDENLGGEIETAYTINNRGLFGVFRAGDEVNALIANGEDIAIGDELISAGDGTLKEYVVADSAGVDLIQDHSIVAVALAACDMSDSSSVDPSPRCLVEVI